MLRIRFSLALITGLAFASVANAQIGPVPVGVAKAFYNSTSGEIVVSVNGVNNWFVHSVSGGLTGEEPSHSPILPGSLLSDTDFFIGETGFALGTGTDVSLGKVAALPISAIFDDLTINWNAGLGAPRQTSRFERANLTPEPFAVINGPFLIDLATDPLSITLDASDTFAINFEPQFSWDLDGQPGFEVSTGITRTLEIADVAATFGGVGVYPVGVFVSDAGGTSEAFTTVTIINTAPEPASLALVGMGIAFASSMRRRRNLLEI